MSRVFGHRGALMAAAGLAAAVGLAGCGGEGTQQHASAATKAAKQPLAARAVVAEVERRVGTSGAVKFTARAGTGVPGSTNNAGNAARMSGTVGHGVAAFSFSSPELSTVTEGILSTSTAPVRQSGTSTYIDFGAQAAAETGGMRWLEATSSDLATDGIEADPLDALVSQGLDPVGEHPAAQLAILLRAQQIRSLGAEDADGVVADHYQGDVTAADIAEAGSGMRGIEAARTKALARQLKSSGLRTETVDVWVAKSGARAGRPVRLDLTLDMNTGITTDTIHYTAYGATPLHVTVPPSAQRIPRQGPDEWGAGVAV